jgi:hypothetical protein
MENKKIMEKKNQRVRGKKNEENWIGIVREGDRKNTITQQKKEKRNAQEEKKWGAKSR